MINRIELKNKAKESLNNKYFESIKLLLTLFIISLGFEIIYALITHFTTLDSSNIYNIFTNVIELIITGTISFGYISFFLKISRDENVTSDELFSKADMLPIYIVSSILIGIFTFLGAIFFIIPGIIIAISLSQTFYILLDNPTMNIKEALLLSKKMMNGYKLEFFILKLSFLGWLILGIFTFGILYLWLIPYMNVTEANFYNEIKEIYNKKNLE